MKRCLFVVILIHFSLCGISQGLQGGIHLGGNASQVDGDQSAGFNQIGLSLGVFVAYELGDPWSFQLEMLYEQLGSAREGILILRNHQISLPVVLRYELPIELSDGQHRIGLQAGLSPGYLFLAKSEFVGDVTDLLLRYDLRAVAGVEYRFSAVNALLMRYGYSVFSFLDTNAPLSSNLLGPGKVGLAHNYITLAWRIWL